MKASSSTPRAVAVCIDTRDGAGRNRLHGVAQYARRAGWRMMLVRNLGKSAAEEATRLRPDGIIAYVSDEALLEVAQRLRVPLVDTALGELPIPYSVSIDNQAIARLAAEHFLQTGLKHLGFCGVLGRIASDQRQECFTASVPGRRMAAFSEPVSEGESRLAPLMRWLKALPKPVGLLMFDDKLGERVLTACRWAGLSVPHDVAVLGIGDDQLMCEVSWPTLSSVRLPTSRLGFEAAQLLDAAMAGRKITDPHRKVQPTGVVARGSTDMVAVDDALVKATIEHIRTRAGDLIGVEQVAQALGVSRRTLDRRFSIALGRTVRDELARVRMQTARALLADNSHAIAAVARRCGYGNAASFSRAFRQRCGRWPSEYRSELEPT